jgi:hypothetical protein
MMDEVNTRIIANSVAVAYGCRSALHMKSPGMMNVMPG